MGHQKKLPPTLPPRPVSREARFTSRQSRDAGITERIQHA